ncbi:MAG: efflux RND transporter permease subunit, partial [Pseudomonadota bacterium]
MSGLVDWALARIRMILTFVVLTVGAGGAAYVGLPKEGSPNIDVPILFVTASLPGASAADVERLVLKPLETELRDLDGLKEMQTFATQGAASALLEFDFGWDKGDTVAETRDRLSRAETEFPDDAEDARVIEVNLSEFPVLVVSLSGAAPERTMTRLAKALERDIEALPSVLEVDLAGARDEIVEVLVDPLKLESLGLSAQELVAIVSRNNSLVPAGALEAGSAKFDFSVPGSFETAEEVKALPVKVSGDRIVRLGEVAEIRRTFEDRAGWARFNSEPTLALQVKKRLGANILDTTQDVRARVAETTADWPPALRAAVRVDFSLDRSREVRSMVSQLESSVLTAVLLVMIVVLAALGPRSALLVGLAVPSSFLLAFALFGALGYAVNNMVMFGLILAVGMLVDGAIVVAEYADKRMAEGAPPEAAYGEAAKRMFWPIVTSTATTLCAFLPMLLWPGLPGQFMGQLPLTLIFVLSASLLVALVYLPALGVVIGRASAAAGRALAP